jgi:hypothetical protein
MNKNYNRRFHPASAVRTRAAVAAIHARERVIDRNKNRLFKLHLAWNRGELTHNELCRLLGPNITATQIAFVEGKL